MNNLIERPKLKLIIAGTRTLFVSPDFIDSLLLHFNLRPTEIISGMAKGMDISGVDYANLAHISVKPFPIPDDEWIKYGKPAGPMRNKKMADYADALLLCWDGKSSGSRNMKLQMVKLNKPIYEVILK